MLSLAHKFNPIYSLTSYITIQLPQHSPKATSHNKLPLEKSRRQTRAFIRQTTKNFRSDSNWFYINSKCLLHDHTSNANLLTAKRCWNKFATWETSVVCRQKFVNMFTNGCYAFTLTSQLALPTRICQLKFVVWTRLNWSTQAVCIVCTLTHRPGESFTN